MICPNDPIAQLRIFAAKILCGLSMHATQYNLQHSRGTPTRCVPTIHLHLHLSTAQSTTVHKHPFVIPSISRSSPSPLPEYSSFIYPSNADASRTTARGHGGEGLLLDQHHHGKMTMILVIMGGSFTYRGSSSFSLLTYPSSSAPRLVRDLVFLRRAVWL